jgi:3-methyladenine DNA glycosylase AlkC
MNWRSPTTANPFEVPMLSHEDERRFAAIERQLMSDDPAFVRRLARRGRRARVRWSRALTAAVAVVCALATVLGLAGSSPELYLSSIVLTVVAGWLYYQITRRRC